MGESKSTFQRNISPSSLASKTKPSRKTNMKQAASRTGMLGLLFDPKNVGNRYLQNVSTLQHYTALYPRRWKSYIYIFKLLFQPSYMQHVFQKLI
jgi:hypothetical protein